MHPKETLFADPNALAPFYSRFRVGERLLLTGHSHQAWPDCGFEGQQEAWLDAAEHVDDKWERAFAKADRVREGFSHLLDDDNGSYALAPNTHDLVVRFLSALPLRERRRIVTTDGEYHSMRRQLDRLAEEGIEVFRVASHPATDVAARLIDAVDDRTAAVMVSAVFYQTGHIVQALGDVAVACVRHGAELLVDAYHAINVVPFSIATERLRSAFVVGGGYKYCQLGEGNCFMRFPPDCRHRPVITGWFSEFSSLASPSADRLLQYGREGDRFAGSTYDPTSHYRAARVFEFFLQHELTPHFLRVVSRHQIDLLASQFDELDIDPKIMTRDRSLSLDRVGGFLALQSPRAADISGLLRDRDVLTDFRGNLLRLGPAPYLSDAQLVQAMGHLEDIVRSL